MGQIEHFSTRLVARGKRHLLWRDIIAATFPGMTAYADEGICADLARWSLGPLGLARATSAPAHVSRLANRDGRNILVHLLKSGRVTMVHGDALSLAGPGDIVIADDRYSYAIDVSARNDCMIVKIPAHLLGPDAALENLHGRVLRGDHPTSAFLGGMISALWSKPTMRDGLDVGVADLLTDAVQIALRSAQPCADDAHVWGEQETEGRAPVEFVLANLSNPALGTAMICDATGLTPRAIQKSFLRDTARTPTGYITERRLARAADLLVDGGNRTVTEIAYEVGYSDAAFFSRKFRAQFGVPPRRFRDEALAGMF